MRSPMAMVECALPFITVKGKVGSLRPQVVDGPEHASSVQLIEAIVGVHKHNENEVPIG